MKLFLPSLLAFSLSSSLAALELGESVSLEAVAAAEFLKGEAPTEWKKDELYIFECWATWCGPCIAAIPHMDELYDKYKEEGLNVVGMNVWEDKKEKVTKFVTNKGEGMSYPNAFVGQGGAFETEWLKPAGVKGIPHAFIVRNGEYLFSLHPASITEELIKDLLAGGEKAEAIVNGQRKAVERQKEIAEVIKAFTGAADRKDLTKMKASMAALQELEPQSNYNDWMTFKIALAEKNWDEVTRILGATESSQEAAQSAQIAAEDIGGLEEEASPEFLNMLIELIEKKNRMQAYDNAVLASLYFKTNQKAKALEAVEKALASPGIFSTEVLQSYADSIEEDSPEEIKALRERLAAALQEKK